MFTRDASLITKAGAIPLQMGKALRKPEPELHKQAYEKLGIPILGQLTGKAKIEGGDTIWLNEKTLLVGMGFRSNQAGVDQRMHYLTHKVLKYLVSICHTGAVRKLVCTSCPSYPH